MKTEDLIQRVQSAYSKGAASDDSRLSNRLIYNKLLTSRSRLFGQKLNKRQKISQWNYQTLPCIELIEADKNECPCLPPAGCKWLKSKHPLPRVFTNLNVHIIEYVTSVDGAIDFSESTWIKVRNKKGNKYTANKPDYFIKDNYLYLTHPGGPRVVSLSGLFQDPLSAEYFPSFCDGADEIVDCQSPLDKEFPIDADDLDTLIEMAQKELVLMFSQMKEDLSNDSKDSVIQNSK